MSTATATRSGNAHVGNLTPKFISARARFMLRHGALFAVVAGQTGKGEVQMRRRFNVTCLMALCLTLLMGQAHRAEADGDVAFQFLGNTTLVFDDGHTRIMTDGFLSRLPLRKLLLGIKIETDEDAVTRALRQAKVDDTAAIFVAHAHFDHAMDVAHVANRFDARVFGSRSTRAVALAGDVPDHRITVLHDERRYQIGNFTVTAIYTPHGDPNRFPGELRPGFKTPARMKDFRANENYSFHIRNGQTTALVVPGGNYLSAKLNGYDAQTVFLGIGGLNGAAQRAAGRGDPDFIADYWRETVQAVGAKTVVPIHWDNFFVPLTPGVRFRSPPAIIEGFAATRARLTTLAEADGVCIHWMTEPFLTRTLNADFTCGEY
ncbi:MBL fold metallo-hydrolase [uncultured Tateyamaria sp.]|uniref:MBL fold metallo-hydrolase n=1 Tax=uncultured Tateyamaria sp. TaxID=455651 RepID=UPI00261B8CB2|nr:MBL fold metallo-hydrolase [uncultured Tateyamaria sp.]